MMEKGFELVAAAIRREMARGVFPCAVAEIGNAKGARWRFAEGMRCLASPARPVNENTLFDMASVSKILSVTSLVLLLIEEGVLSPSDSLGLFWEHLPEASARMTVGQLLTHTSGLPGGKSIVGFPREALAPAILNLPLAYQPGTQVRYACLGFLVLGELLEKITGESLDALAQKRVFSPLGMTRTTYAPQTDNIAATSLEADDLGIVNDYNARYLNRPVGNAGVFSDVTDCGIFARMLLNQGAPLLSAATLRAANQDYTPFSGDARGWGFYRFNRRENPVCELCSPVAFGHSGWTGTSIMADPENDFYLVLLTNRTCVARQDDQAIWRARRYIHNAGIIVGREMEE